MFRHKNLLSLRNQHLGVRRLLFGRVRRMAFFHWILAVTCCKHVWYDSIPIFVIGIHRHHIVTESGLFLGAKCINKSISSNYIRTKQDTNQREDQITKREVPRLNANIGVYILNEEVNRRKLQIYDQATDSYLFLL